MAGFQLPITAYTQQQLAEMAQRAFRPPALMSGGGGGGGGMQMPQAQGFNVGQGMAGMGQGLGMLAGALGKGGGIDAEIKDWSGYGSPAGRASLDNMMATNSGQMIGPSNASFGDLGGMGGTYGGGLADGGPVMPGQYYTVGERGPETFVPAVPGTIVPNDPYSAVRPSEMPLYDPYSAVRPSEMPLYDPSSVLRPSEMPLYDPSSVLRPSERDFFGGLRRRR